MKKAQQIILITLLLTVILFSTGCSSSGDAPKKLDETAAKNLIKDRLTKEPYKIQADNISRLLGRTPTDYKTVSTGNAHEGDLKRLIDKGFVLQTVQTISYPKISGTFISQNQNAGVWTVYDLELRPNSNALAGDSYRASSPDKPIKPPSAWWVQGTVEPDGRLKLNTSGAEEDAKYVEEGAAAYIDFQGGSLYGRYKGPATGKKIDVNMYTYSWSPEFVQKSTARAGSQLYVLGGDFEIGEVSGLRLVTDTVATARFSWKASMNDAGRVFFPSQAPSGTGEVSFGKKPDGTWFVDEVKID